MEVVDCQIMMIAETPPASGNAYHRAGLLHMRPIESFGCDTISQKITKQK